MNHLSSLLDFLQEMYDGYGFSETVGINYFKEFFSKTEELSIAELIALQVKRYSSDYVFDFLLSTPYLWSNLSGSEWLEIMSLVNPRPDPILIIDLHHSHFADIHFLCKYLQVDALSLFVENERFSKSDKQNILKYFQRNSAFFFMDELDTEDMDGEYFVNFSTVEEVKSRLISDGVFREFAYTEDELVNYVEQLKRKWN